MNVETSIWLIMNEPHEHRQFANGAGILQLDANGQVDVRATTGNCTVTIWTYGYVLYYKENNKMNNNTPHDESENSPPGQGTYKDRIDASLARIAEDIALLREGRRIDELSANEIEQSIVRYYGVYVRLLTMGVKVKDDQPERLLSLTLPVMGKDDEAESRFKTIDLSNYSLMGERKITPGKPTPRECLVLWVDEDWQDEDEESIG